MAIQSNLNAGFGTVPMWSMELFQNATATCLSTVKHVTELESDWQSFVQQRLEKDAHFPEKLMNCKTPSDFLQAQFNFVSDFFIDYTNEFQRIGEMAREAASEPILSSQKGGAVSAKA